MPRITKVRAPISPSNGCLSGISLGNHLESLFSSISLPLDARSLEEMGEHQNQLSAYFTLLSSIERGAVLQSENTFQTLRTIDWRRSRRLDTPSEIRYMVILLIKMIDNHDSFLVYQNKGLNSFLHM